MNKPLIATLAGVSRAPFLPLSALCAVLGMMSGWPDSTAFPLGHAMLAGIAALLAHASVNAFNEYADFRSGLDLHTERTPFSGGSGSLPASPAHATAALAWATLTLLLTAGIGLYFVLAQGGWPLAIIGISGVLLVVTYTPWLNRYPWLCLLAPGIGFGPVIVGGSSLAMSGALPPATLWSSLIVGLLASGLLLANQQPDADIDAQFGRRHLTITHGRTTARRVLALLWLLPLPLLLGAIAMKDLPPIALWSGLPLLLAIANTITLLRIPTEIALPHPLLGRNVIVCLTFPLLLSILIWLQH